MKARAIRRTAPDSASVPGLLLTPGDDDLPPGVPAEFDAVEAAADLLRRHAAPPQHRDVLGRRVEPVVERQLAPLFATDERPSRARPARDEVVAVLLQVEDAAQLLERLTAEATYERRVVDRVENQQPAGYEHTREFGEDALVVLLRLEVAECGPEGEDPSEGAVGPWEVAHVTRAKVELRRRLAGDRQDGVGDVEPGDVVAALSQRGRMPAGSARDVEHTRSLRKL